MNVDRFQLVLVALIVHGVVTFSAWQAAQTHEQENLKNFSTVVLEDIVDAVLGSQFLVSAII